MIPMIPHQCNNKLYNQYCEEKKASRSQLVPIEKTNKIDEAIIRFIIEDMQPFRRVETPAFRNLIAGTGN